MTGGIDHGAKLATGRSDPGDKLNIMQPSRGSCALGLQLVLR